MKTLFSLLFLTCILVLPADTEAQQSQEFGEFEVHYNALNTDLIPAQVAQAYRIKRSSSRALINITILRKTGEIQGTPVSARVKTNAANLTGQRRKIRMREIKEAEDAIYYIGELPIHNLETFYFTVEIQPEESTETFVLEFNQQFYTE
jgi:hypothetical protein